MTQNEMVLKAKEFAEREYAETERFAQTADDIIKGRHFAVGVLQFVTECYPDTYDELNNWWENGLWNKFQELVDSKR